jgi:hypothetical protein
LDRKEDQGLRDVPLAKNAGQVENEGRGEEAGK